MISKVKSRALRVSAWSACLVAGIALSCAVSGVHASNIVGLWQVLNGGTGRPTLTSNAVLLGNGTAPLLFAASSNSSLALCGGSPPSFGSGCGGVGVGVSSVNTLTGAVTLFNTNAQTATYQVLAADFTHCRTITVASGTFTITLVAAGSQPADGQCVDVFNYGAGVVTIARSGQNINGGTTALTLNAGSATAPSWAHVVSDGANYEAAVVNPSIATSFTPVTVLHYAGQRGSGSLALTNFAAGNVVVITLDGEGTTLTEPTLVWSDATTCSLAGNGLIGGGNNMTTYVCVLASAAPTVTPTFPGTATFVGTIATEFPVSLVQGVIDSASSVRNCCAYNAGVAPLRLTTTAPDIIVMSVGYNGNADFNLCQPNGLPASRNASGGADSAQVCFSYSPAAVTNMSVNPIYVNDGTNAVQAVAIKHQ